MFKRIHGEFEAEANSIRKLFAALISLAETEQSNRVTCISLVVLSVRKLFKRGNWKWEEQMFRSLEKMIPKEFELISKKLSFSERNALNGLLKKELLKRQPENKEQAKMKSQEEENDPNKRKMGEKTRKKSTGTIKEKKNELREIKKQIFKDMKDENWNVTLHSEMRLEHLFLKDAIIEIAFPFCR